MTLTPTDDANGTSPSKPVIHPNRSVDEDEVLVMGVELADDDFGNTNDQGMMTVILATQMTPQYYRP